MLFQVIAATEITAYRTAAASAVATNHLLRGKVAKSLAILGAGTQGQSHAKGLLALCMFEKVIFWFLHIRKMSLKIFERHFFKLRCNNDTIKD